ncbi:MAG: DUF4147 domain-containing protein [Parvularculaceae bacterium]|nr:DUF4147 domain-containing protein [Parvularculaceae bacterium]
MNDPQQPDLVQRERLLRIVARVQAAVDAANLLKPHLAPLDRARSYLVLGAGKASAAMARAVAEALPGARGLVVAQKGAPGVSPAGDPIGILEAAHPVPDQSSVLAAEQILGRCRAAAPDDEILFLLSGGASSLMALPAPGLCLADKQAATRALLARGAPIEDINTVRKHLSAVKGGRLSAATRAPMRTFALSDVPGDDPASIGSGPTVPDPTTQEQARDILRRWRINPSAKVAAALADFRNETPKSHREGRRRDFTLIGGPSTAVAAACAAAAAEGYEPIALGVVAGVARRVAAEHARLALQVATRGRPVALVSGGELSVTLDGASGAGGRCREYLLALAVAAGACGVCAAAWDSDGVDGQGTDAGALLFADSVARAALLGVDACGWLDAHRSGEFFTLLGDAIAIGAQPTNVGDVRVILVGAPPPS